MNHTTTRNGAKLWFRDDKVIVALTHEQDGVLVVLFAGDRIAGAFGDDTRSAYREADHKLRLSRHDTVDLLRENHALRKSNKKLKQMLNENKLHYRRLLLERSRELGEAQSALGIVLREIMAARENSQTLRQHLPEALTEPGALATAVRVLCDLASGQAETISSG